jgi:translocation and assembly module TamB
VATLAGRSGAGIIGNLRQQFGLDDLDLTTDADGNVALKIGTYINENVYTDLSVDAQGRTEIDLNLKVTPNVTAKGRLSDDGSTGIGIYYERDY